MGKNKLKHFEEMLSFPNVFQFDQSRRGRWSEVFGNPNPITLELACGKGEYAVGLAQLHPERNYIGVDVKGARIYTGAKRALDNSLDNVRFLRIQIDHLPEYFGPDEVDEIWITFPDPHLRLSRARQRLTSPKYLGLYRHLLKKGGTVNLKTDDDTLFSYTLDVIAEAGLPLLETLTDVYASEPRDPRLGIRTYYEGKHLAHGRTIKFVRFALN